MRQIRQTDTKTDDRWDERTYSQTLKQIRKTDKRQGQRVYKQRNIHTDRKTERRLNANNHTDRQKIIQIRETHR